MTTIPDLFTTPTARQAARCLVGGVLLQRAGDLEGARAVWAAMDTTLDELRTEASVVLGALLALFVEIAQRHPDMDGALRVAAEQLAAADA